MAANQRDLSFLLESDKYLSGLPTVYRTLRTDEEDANKTEASKILAQEGIGSAREIISSLGLTSAKDIIAKDKEQTDRLLAEKSATPPSTSPISTKPPELSGLKTSEEIKKQITELDKTPELLGKQLATKQITQAEYTKQIQDYVGQQENLVKANIAADSAEQERRRQEEIQRLRLEKLAEETKLRNSIEAKKQNIFNSPELLQQAEDKYGASVKLHRETYKPIPGQAMEEKEWYFLSDAKERLLYDSLDFKERLYYDKIKEDQYAYEREEALFIQDFVKNLSFSEDAVIVESPKFGKLDFSKMEPSPLGQISGTEVFSQGLTPKVTPAVQGGDKLYAAQQEWKAKVKEIDNDPSLDLVVKMQLKRQLGDMPKEIASVTEALPGASTYSYKMGDYVFLPEDVLLKGIDGPGGQYFNTGFLEQNTWASLIEKAQPIDLSGIGEGGVKVGDTSLGRGFLFKQTDWLDFSSNIDSRWVKNSGFNSAYAPDNMPILGIANINGELQYVREAGYKVGKDRVNFVSVDKTGYMKWNYSEEHSGLRGVAQDFSQAFAQIPFAAEVVGIATGNPALYASLKAVQTAGAGGDLKDVTKTAVISFVTAQVGSSLANYGQSVGSSISSVTGLPEGVSNFLGGAIVGSATNGVIASVTGGDVNKAMLAGAVGGGFSASAADFTNTVFGGEANVANIAKSVNLAPKQFQSIFTGAVANGAIAAGVYDKDFIEVFSQSLITQGLSVSAANAVAKNLGDNVSPAQRKIIAQNTALFVRTAAHAAINKVDLNDALKAVAPKVVADTLGQGLREALKSDNK
jgi:hypothetical protein